MVEVVAGAGSATQPHALAVTSVAAAWAVSTVTDQLTESLPAAPAWSVRLVKVQGLAAGPGGAGVTVPVRVPTAMKPLAPWATQPSGPKAWAEGRLKATMAPTELATRAAPNPRRVIVRLIFGFRSPCCPLCP